jgi:hypothetical protein
MTPPFVPSNRTIQPGLGNRERSDRAAGAQNPALHIQYVERCLHPKPKGVNCFANRLAPISRRETGPKSMTSDLVANVHSPLKPGAPPPAAVSGDHDAAEAVAPVAVMAMAVMATTHATTTLAPTTLAPASSGSFGGDERGGADSGDGGDSENRLADHGSLLVVIGCVLTSTWSVMRTIRRVQQRESQIAHFVIAITFAEAIAGQSWAGGAGACIRACSFGDRLCGC